MLKRLLEKLSEDLKLEQPLAPNDDGSYSLQLEPEFIFNFIENRDESVLISIVLAALPQVKTEEFLLKAMVANLLGRETGGGTLGLDKEGKKVVFMHLLPAHLPYRDFHDKLEDFINYAESWRKETTAFAQLQD